ncbi:MAG: peptidoglycan DD-metalloendopeptidase family protein [Anaerolineae bacterium]|nr:peptidoglycan DD-metalloendopeptidase family protein [Anaerolineae bacterium]
MNKLGFYTKNFAAPGVIEAIKTIKPPVLLTELDDFSVLQHIRNEWSPNTFVIGRFYYTPGEQGAMLDDPDPVAVGIRIAEKVLSHNFSFAKQRGQNGRLYIDAWMSLNEVVRGPASFPPKAQWRDEDHQNWTKMERQAAAYDTIQMAFLDRLKQEGLEAVAFNFAAGNWINGQDYLKYFPKTLERYTYLGFHEYGWPHMNPQEPGARSGCGIYCRVMEVIRQQYGNQHRAIITEAGLARMYMLTDGGDVGWLYRNDPVAEASYKSSLRWYNGLLCGAPYTVGACLFQVGPGPDWESFRHTGLDNQDQPLSLMQELKAMADEPEPLLVAEVSPTPAVEVAAKPPPERELVDNLLAAGEHLIIPLNRQAMLFKMAQENSLGDRLTGEYEAIAAGRNYTAQIFEAGLVYAPTGQWDQATAVPLPLPRSPEAPQLVWTQEVTALQGNRWNYWEQYLQGKIPGLTWQVFMEECAINNPHLADDGYIFCPDKVYKMPKVEDQPQVAVQALAVTPAHTQPAAISATLAPDFVQVIGGQFYLKGKPMRFIGANIRGLVHYGCDSQDLPHTHPDHQAKQLQEATIMNARLVRVFLAHKNAIPQEVEARLRRVLALIGPNFPDIYLLPALTNMYSDVPFYVQGDGKFYNPNLSHTFFESGYKENYLPFVQYIVNAFKHEPHIFAWEIGNELKAQYDDQHGAPELLVNFMLDMARQIKQLDPYHLITTGMISTRQAWMADRQDLRHKLYGSPQIDFFTNHPYNGNKRILPEKGNPAIEVEDDLDLARQHRKPLIIEEAGFDRRYFANRPEKTQKDMAYWFGEGASCYMPWGFMATDQDNGDSDIYIGMGRCLPDLPKHEHEDWLTPLPDWAELYELHRQCGELLLNRPVSDDVSSAIANISFMLRRGMVEVLPWPLLTDGFDFPVGKPNGLGYYVAAGLVNQSYFNERGGWHTGEDWNGRGGGDSDLGAPVYAVANGRVVTSQRYPMWGNIILLEHRLPWGQIVWSQYAHLKDRFVRKGDVIRRGDQIGTIGKGDGDRYPAHLHFEIRVKAVPAGKWWGNTQADREKVLQAYVHPINFINANRPR